MIKIKRLHNLYTIDKTYYYDTPFKTEHNHIFKSGNKVTAKLKSNGLLEVYDGFQFDGCSPKFKITIGSKTFIFGTPDGCIGQDGYPLLFHAALKHDVLCKMFKQCGFIYSRKTIDKEFQKDLKKVKWKWRGLYYSAVRVYAKIRGYK